MSPFEFLDEVFVQATKSILDSTVQIFERKDGRPEALGSGVFFEYEGHHFLLTASHVTYTDKEIYINYEEDLNTIGGIWLNSHVSHDYVFDKYDLGILQIDTSFVSHLKEYYFLTIHDIDVDHYFKKKHNNIYLAVGFPVRKTYRTGRKIKGEPFIYWSKQSPKEKYENLQISPINHLLLEYNIGKVFNKNGRRQFGPRPNGASGCGVWHIEEIYVRKGVFVPKKLTAIFFFYEAGGINSLISLNIGVYTEVIRRVLNVGLKKARSINLRLAIDENGA